MQKWQTPWFSVRSNVLFNGAGNVPFLHCLAGRPSPQAEAAWRWRSVSIRLELNLTVAYVLSEVVLLGARPCISICLSRALSRAVWHIFYCRPNCETPSLFLICSSVGGSLTVFLIRYPLVCWWITDVLPYPLVCWWITDVLLYPLVCWWITDVLPLPFVCWWVTDGLPYPLVCWWITDGLPYPFVC